MYFVRQKTNELLLMRGAEEGEVHIVKELLKMNTSVSGLQQMTPLLLAASNGHDAVVEMLLDAGADTEKRNAQGNTPLIWAAHNNRFSVCKILLDHGAKVNVSDQHKNTPLHYAAMFGYLPVVQLLVEHGADTAAVNEYDRTAMQEAHRNDWVNVVNWLQMEKANNKTFLTEADLTVDVSLFKFEIYIYRV